MTRETKVGLLFGMALILVIGILVSDFLVQPPTPAGSELTRFGEQAQAGYPAGGTALDHRVTENATARREVSFPMPGESMPAAGSAGANAPNTIDQPRSEFLPESLTARREADLSIDELIARQREYERRSPDVAPGVTPGAALGAASGAAMQPRPVEERVVVGGSQPSERELLAPASRADQGVVHVVGRNESLYQIARKYYHNGEQWQMIRDANRESVGPDGQVREGARLRIPMSVELSHLPQFEAVDERQESTGLAPVGSGSGGGHVIIVVQPGQTLGEIASAHLGSSGRWPEIFQANREQLKSERDLRAGMEIRVPRSGSGGGEAAVNVARSENTIQRLAPAPPRPTGGSYTVQSNDSLYRIAATKLGDGNRWREILAANKGTISNENQIKVGMTLVLPAR